MPSSTTVQGSARRPASKAGAVASEVDNRFTMAAPTRRMLNKVFPDHWSFMLGEIAMYAFIMLLLTGTYLALFFDASMKEVVYNGSYVPLQGVPMSAAYESTLNLSFDVRGGLIIRQMHHWAALLFMAAMLVHMLRVFFTGAFRKPRETNWLIGIVLIFLGIAEGFMGYSLPDDLLSGTGLRITSGVMLSIPFLGTFIHYALFGGEFPGTLIIGRFYILHVLLIPGIMLALIGAHLLLVFKQKHTQWPGPRATEDNVVGHRFYPIFAAKGAALSMLTFGVITLLGGLVQINAVWLLGPYDPSQVSSGSQPDWYMFWSEGMARLFPPWEIRVFGITIPEIFLAIAALGPIIVGFALYPMIERKLTGDNAHHNLLQRPRDVPVRTALGAMAITFYLVLSASGANDIIAEKFDISLNAMTWGGRIALVILPPIAYWVTYRICLGLQRHDREVLDHGIETGILVRSPNGGYFERHQPLGPVDEHGHSHLTYGGAPVPKKMNKVGGAGRAIRGFFFPIETPPTPPTPEGLAKRGIEQRDEVGAQQ
ncbi:cytochrome bc complex cytochrome b subunit [Blastococcus sp. Marseille-P5729]|uniref:cytochrome bc1 complex cytochrome b subunit n=1 Tax=Blastococcus sp. Marseille-P5729 TaxID=2086582 RepID=UPI000D10F406|nr:cytochrome bc complex cytochrome b subunit [Blastococcus sp. Marseille-P5729]